MILFQCISVRLASMMLVIFAGSNVLFTAVLAWIGLW